MHTGTICVKDPCHLDFDPILAVIIEEKSFSTSFPFIVTGSGSNGVYASEIGLRLGVNCGISIHLRSGGLEDSCLEAFSESQHVNGTMDIDLCGLNRVVLVMDRRCRAGEVINSIHLDVKRESYVMAKKFKKRILEKMLNISLRPGVKVIDADHILPFFKEAFAEVRTQKTSPSRHQYMKLIWFLQFNSPFKKANK
jgi:hypothetical protein